MATVRATPLRAIAPAHAADQAHRAVGGAFPRFIERAAQAVRVQLVERRRGELFDALAGVHAERVRAPRRDWLANMASFMTALLYGMEADSLFVRAPRAGGAPERYSWPVYDHRAYGAQVEQERSIKRTFRNSARAQAAGLLEVRELGEVVGNDYRSIVAHKRLTAELVRMLGLMGAWKHLRRERQQERADAQRKRAEQLVRATGSRRRPAAPAPSPARPAAAAPTSAPDRPPKPPPDARSPAAAAALAEIAALLGRTG